MVMRALAINLGVVWVMVLAAGVAYVLRHAVPFEPDYIYGFERNMTRLPQQDDLVESDYTRTTVFIPSHGEKLEAWLYEPTPQNPISPPPVVIMSHGLGSQKDMGLHPFAEQFAQAGMAVVVFDFRSFGGSDGMPRHWASWRRHVEDEQAALDWVASGALGEGRVDTARIALWGVSYSGGHALMVASKKQNWDKVNAVVASEPFMSGDGNVLKAFKERGPLLVARLLFASFLDKARELTGGEPIYLKLIAAHGELAVLNVGAAELAASRSGQKSPPVRIGGWKNAVAARMLIDTMTYKPIKHVADVQCPVLLVAATHDELTPAKHVHRAKELLGDKATLLERPFGHIEMHRKMADPKELEPIIAFLRLHLGLHPVKIGVTHPHEADLEAAAASEVL